MPIKEKLIQIDLFNPVTAVVFRDYYLTLVFIMY